MKKLQIEMGNSYKLGVNEVVGLKKAIYDALQPITDVLREKAYWNKELEPEESEYKSRDGFIANSSNCGGLELSLIVPECESYEWDFLEFGEAETDPETGEFYENRGELDAVFRVWFKFEGIEGTKLKFYLYAGGGNDDAPYFRSNYEKDIFEASFECSTPAGLKRASAVHVKALLNIIKGLV